jgi:hypothetical protein
VSGGKGHLPERAAAVAHPFRYGILLVKVAVGRVEYGLRRA